MSRSAIVVYYQSTNQPKIARITSSGGIYKFDSFLTACFHLAFLPLCSDIFITIHFFPLMLNSSYIDTKLLSAEIKPGIYEVLHVVLQIKKASKSCICVMLLWSHSKEEDMQQSCSMSSLILSCISRTSKCWLHTGHSLTPAISSFIFEKHRQRTPIAEQLRWLSE